MKIKKEMLDDLRYLSIWFNANFPCGEANHNEIFEKLSKQKDQFGYQDMLASRFNLTIMCYAWHSNGKIASKCEYKNGKIDGLSQFFYTNGKLREKTVYKNDEKNGIEKFFYKNGNIESIYPYKHGKMVGISLVFYKSGNLKFIWDHVQDELFGTSKKFNEDGVEI